MLVSMVRRMRSFVSGDCAQATVEAAVVLPVMLVIALISYNLMCFCVAVARFDRVAPHAVLVLGAVPSGDGLDGAAGGTSGASVIQAEIDRAMGGMPVEVEVELDDAPDASDGLLALSGSVVAYRCVMRYKPWPSGLHIAGVDLGAPFVLEHVREVRIDPWRPGVVV